MITGKINPAYIQFVVASGIAVVVGLGLVALTDIQVDLILKFVGAVLLLFGVTTIPTAGAVQSNVDEAYNKGLATEVPKDLGY